MLWFLERELEDRPPADWDEGARSYLEAFLTLHSPVHRTFLGFKRHEKPQWTEFDYHRFLYLLGCAGYGWLRPEGVKKKLLELAANWTGPPPLK